MTNPFDRLDAAAERVEHRVTWETANRRGLLWTHACVGLTAGPFMLAFGSSTTIEAAIGVWTRTVLGLLSFVGGLLLASGLLVRPRSVKLEAAGLAVLALWDLCMVAGFILARAKQADFTLRGLDEALPAGCVVAYPVPVYAGIFALLVIHLWTLRKLRRQTHGRPDDER